MTIRKAKTVTETRAEIRGMVAQLDEICKADVRKHAANRKPGRGARLKQAEKEVAKPDARCVYSDMAPAKPRQRAKPRTQHGTAKSSPMNRAGLLAK